MNYVIFVPQSNKILPKSKEAFAEMIRAGKKMSLDWMDKASILMNERVLR